MTEAHRVTLGPAQETLLIPLYGRAVESRKPGGLLSDPRAVEMVEAIDYDFTPFDGTRSLFGSVLRTLIFDGWVAAFLAEHPEGTVVEVGCGLNTRFERLDNDTLHWIDLDLPDVVELRRRFFADTDRRTTIAASVLDEAWVEEVRQRPGPYFFAAEASILYLSPPDVEAALGLIAGNFPGSHLALDTWGSWILDHQDRHDTLKNMDARLTWACDDPAELEQLGLGLRLAESRTFARIPKAIRSRMPWSQRLMFAAAGRVLPQVRAYRLNHLTIAPRPDVAP
jgi:O-methyltransferase involved in polyketide biosynthesis